MVWHCSAVQFAVAHANVTDVFTVSHLPELMSSTMCRWYWACRSTMTNPLPIR